MTTISDSGEFITYKLSDVSKIAHSLHQVERIILDDDSVPGEPARSILSELNFIRGQLLLKSGVRRHKKFAPELQKP